ncbi:MAG TPA: hydroxyacylglutathione hydrolase [Steroidobacteraceae bacterium]|nr:hydroxyacylglutathione hydrolase [Steroidobacteraceae bacterium]HRX88305.1 hydroxyacylglutathione hydrolase [Steroidobacteraceae bacterium]
MRIERIWPGNAYRNFHYLIACPESGEALAIDPLDWQSCLATARERGYEITQILNTHEHLDHTGGNAGLVNATGARVLAHAGAANRIGNVDVGLGKGDVVRVGSTVELECLDTPGHTRAHICLLSHAEEPALFCGDTLFNAGAGNCHNGGQPELLYQTFAEQLAKLPDNTRIYPGHEYLTNNLAFTLDREPDNADAARWQANAAQNSAADAPVTTLADEKRINTFFRLQNPTIVARLRERFPDLDEHPHAQTVFLKLRELRNRW